MGGQARGMWSWVSFLLFPHPLQVGGCGWVEHDARSCTRFGTLLGPEGTGIMPFTSDRPAGASSLFAMWRRRDASGTAPSSNARNSGDATSQDLDSRPYLENCTVDASIKYFVAKLVRAHGGCLGTRSR